MSNSNSLCQSSISLMLFYNSMALKDVVNVRNALVPLIASLRLVITQQSLTSLHAVKKPLLHTLIDCQYLLPFLVRSFSSFCSFKVFVTSLLDAISSNSSLMTLLEAVWRILYVPLSYIKPTQIKEWQTRTRIQRKVLF